MTVLAQLVIVGAGGFGREVHDVVEALNAAGADLRMIGFVDDAAGSDELLARRRSSRLGDIDLLCDSNNANLIDTDVRFVIGIGSGDVRRAIDERLTAVGRRALTLVHPMATLGVDNRLADGCILTSGSRVTTNVTLGRHVHLNLNSTVGHDAVLGDYVTVHPGATLSGNVQLGEGVTIGTGANVLPGVTIGSGAFVGAGAVVTADVEPGVTVVGAPARPTKR